jgi:hypothetical protein
MAKALTVCVGELACRFLDDPLAEEWLRQARSFVPAAGTPMFSLPLGGSRRARLTLVGISRLSRVPLHDHPRTYGVLRLISGQVRIRSCRPLTESDPRSGVVRLACKDETLARSGSTLTFDPWRNNIHSLESLTLNGVGLSLHLICGADRRRSWFFPVDGLNVAGPELICNRIIGRELLHHGCR